MESDVGKLFIGGISWETTEEKLKNYFKAYGEVVEAVIMKDRVTGRARGFGFVVFADPVVADRVVQDKHNIDGRQVEAKKAVPREEQQNATRNSNAGLAPVHQARTKKIFVGGLAATVTENDFRKYFDQFGAITDVVVMYDHGTQRPRGFGFITYDSEDAVDRVLHTSFHELKGKMVEVKRAIPKEMSPSPVRSTGNALGSVLRGGGPYGSGYGQFNSSPIGPFGHRMDNRYNPSPGINYSPYGPVGYSSSRSFSGAMSAAYNSPYGGAIQSFGRSTSHGSLTTSGMFGGSGGGYGSSPAGGGYGGMTPVRNPWSSGAAGYGSPSLAGGYRHGGAASMAGYSSGIGTWGSSQIPSNSSGFATGNVNYGGADDGYSSGNLGYGGRGSGFGLSGVGYSAGAANSATVAREAGFGDLYSSLVNQETSWKSSAGTDSLNSTSFGGLGFGGFGLGDNSGEDAPANYSSTYASGRQAPRGVQV
ncbi:hypothetical protein GOP47_0011286 [Adiantum capillus-veneris]|uniref:RRM domain-containing protein n=1 Tax=Adiantum capillus-veneris TaxID=13818 RepID=A0A9D4USI3_ADICA|nr:hypothetical protein GOP47_0011286 [Adiantum capillus-veneris]